MQNNDSVNIGTSKLPASGEKVLKDFLKVLLMPMLVNKAFMLYFGLNYAEHPGEGYGYGLVCTGLFLFFTVGRFIWKYRHVEDP